MKPKVLIVGGGPSGSTAAIYLLQHGFRVMLFEKGGKSRNKTCGEGLTPESQHILKKIQMFASIKKIAYQVNQMSLFDLSNRPILLKNKYFTLERSVLDKTLRNKIEELGGKVYHNCTISEWNNLDNRVTIKDSLGNEYKGDILILATGAENTLAKKNGFTSGAYSAVALRAYGNNTIGCDTLEFYFHRKLYPAYGWIFPLPNNKINIGVYTHKDIGPTRDVAKLMDLFYEVLSEKYDKSIHLSSPLQGWVLQTGLQEKNLCRDRVLLVGENISCTYNLSGEGIGPAMKSGLFAAQTIIESKGDYSRKTLRQYEEKVRDGIAPAHYGYNKLFKIFRKAFPFAIATTLLRYIPGLRRVAQDVIDEKKVFKDVFKLKYIIKSMFLSS